MSNDRLTMQGIVKRFGPTTALDGVDLAVRGGEIHALIGENGAGKSTLMKVLAGALEADGGAMTLDGAAYAPTSPAAARALGVAMIHQELSLAPHLTVAENIGLGDLPTRGLLLDRRALRATAVEALRAVGRPDISPDAPVGRLPIAERQLVEIARAVARRSRVLVLDEPTSSLGQDDAAQVFALLRRLKQDGLAIVYISHFLDEIASLTDRYTVLRDGRTVAHGETASAEIGDIVLAMVGRKVDDLYPRTLAAPGEVLLEARDLSGIIAPFGASLAIRRGEVLGIAGLIGAGRTEFLRALFGLDAVASGSVVVGGATLPADPADRWRRRIGLVSEDRKNEGLALGLSLADNVVLPSLGRVARGGFVTGGAIARAALPFLEKLGVKAASPHQEARALSGGNQQKVAIARLLHAECDVLLLDEPTRGIDVGAKAEIYRLIDAMAHTGEPSKRRAVLMVSSYLPELLGLSDRIAVMCRGRLGPARPIEAWDERKLMLEAVGSA